MNWRTTIIGFIILFSTYVIQIGGKVPATKQEWGSFVFGLVVFIGLALSKDPEWLKKLTGQGNGVKTLLILFFLIPFLCSCARTVGYAGAHPGYVKCKGKGSITGTGFGNVSAGIGGGEQNSFTIQADCGDGFEFSQGLPIPEVTPTK
jgi:hypothetical protein